MSRSVKTSTPAVEPWKILVVDDDPEVHAVTRLALDRFEMEGRPLQLLIAMSAAEARRLWSENPDIALVLLDVVMESEHAGLDFVRFVRDQMHNAHTRIVLRTGQPGQAPALDVIERYEIDDYRTKTELTFERLNVLVRATLRTYRVLQQMDERQKQLELSNRDLEQFAYVAAHDLQTPLRGIIGLSQLLQRNSLPQLDTTAQEHLRLIVQGASQMQALVRGLLVFSRLSNQTPVLVPTDCELALATVLTQLDSQIRERQARVTHESLPTVLGNELELCQLLQNLIANAIKFQPGPNPRVHLSAVREGAFWKFAVRDHGIGIAPEHKDRIFKMFQRLHTAEKYEGTGIGLAVCQKIVSRHGGRIWVESQPGQGSTFFFTLKADKASKAL